MERSVVGKGGFFFKTVLLQKDPGSVGSIRS